MSYPVIRVVAVKYAYIYLSNFMRRSAETQEITAVKLIPLEYLISELDTIGARLKEAVRDHNDFIMTEIARLTGIPWQREVTLINVYPIPFFNSFSHPLFLRVAAIRNGRVQPRKIGAILGTLIHELIHNNIERFKIDRNTGEAIITFFAFRILERLDAKFVPEYRALLEIIGDQLDFTLIHSDILDGSGTLMSVYEKDAPEDRRAA